MALQPPNPESTRWMRNIFCSAEHAIECVDFEVMKRYEGQPLNLNGARQVIATPALPLLREVGASKLIAEQGEKIAKLVFRTISAKVMAYSQQNPDIITEHPFAVRQLNSWFADKTPSRLDEFGLILLADMDSYGQSEGAIAPNNRVWQDVGHSCLGFMRHGIEVATFFEE